ncbi:MAG: hypothetical protein DRJ64_02320 [Thermoprotei archaeon]|nr:MAG: hypothetical protein B6U94_04150 [Thermofilum sp. ex4484_79]RLF07782.1 MAG: hypothetical protein DRJ64_02320 [Thermoprotei archaeon]
MSPKIRIEDNLSTGEKISIVLEGDELSKEKVLQLLDMLKLIGGGSSETGSEARPRSIKLEIWDIIKENFGDGTWFSIKDLYNISKNRLNLKVTSISTYVSRLVGEGKLVKRGRKPYTRYRVKVLYVKD